MFNLKVYTMKRQRFFEGLGLKVYVTLAICMALLLNVLERTEFDNQCKRCG